MRTVVLSICLFLSLSGIFAPSKAQRRGAIDFEKSVAIQIRRFEGMVGGDSSARKQAVVLLWLVELYEAIEEYDQVEYSYRRILTFFPDDVGVMNSWGKFLMDTRQNYARADSVLNMANDWGRERDHASVFRGKTWELWGRLAYIQEDYPLSAKRAGNALELLEGGDRAEALRLAGRSYREMGQYDLAAGAFFELIAIEGGSNLEDINELQLFIARTENYSEGSVRDRIATAVAEEKARRHAEIEAGGGTVVELRSPDGIVLEATLRRANGPGAVLFVPDLRGRRLVYTPYAQLLFIDDITTLSVDPRGHGASRADSLLSYDSLSEYHRARLIEDIGTAYRHLRSLGFRDEHIAVVSEGSGCALVEKAMQEEKATPAVLHLSPEFDPHDRDLIHAITFHPDRPVLVFFSDEDIAAMRSTQLFRQGKKRSQLRTRQLRDAGRGLDLLRRSPEALEEFQEWARRTINTP